MLRVCKISRGGLHYESIWIRVCVRLLSPLHICIAYKPVAILLIEQKRKDTQRKENTHARKQSLKYVKKNTINIYIPVV